MTLDDLTKYAEEKYRIQEEYPWPGYPGLSALRDPVTGKWAAMLMRQWDTDSGAEIQRCDIKCGQEMLQRASAPYLTRPYRIRSLKWLGVIVDEHTDTQAVFHLFDLAVSSGEQRGYTMVLPPAPAGGEGGWQDTPLPPRERSFPDEEPLLRRIRMMRALYACVDGSFQEKCRNFYLQGKFMEDYEDDVPWTGEFNRLFPTYQDLSIRQLRGYFSWRTRVRREEYTPIAASAAVLYLNELLNGIGVSGPEEAIGKMKAFERGFLDKGYGDPALRRNLRRWMLEFAILKNLPPDTVRACADADMLARDRAMEVLRHPEEATDEAVYEALCAIGGNRLSASPVMKHRAEKGKRLFSEAWRTALAQEGQGSGKDLFDACFGRKSLFPWHPLANTVYSSHGKRETQRYVLSECREYFCRGGAWYVAAYDRLTFDRKRFTGFLHEADAKLRRYLRTGNYLKEKPENAWAGPYIDRVIDADRKAEQEAARPKIVLDLSGLDRIRRDASVTRDSLLTEADWPDAEEAPEIPVPAAEAPEEPPEEADPVPDAGPEGALDALQVRILRMLLQGGDPASLMRENRLMPSLVADDINEAMFEEFGDTVLLCDGDRLSLVEDYREDLEQMLGGAKA